MATPARSHTACPAAGPAPPVTSSSLQPPAPAPVKEAPSEEAASSYMPPEKIKSELPQAPVVVTPDVKSTEVGVYFWISWDGN